MDSATPAATRADASSLTVPTGLQANSELSRRRWLLATLNIVTWVAMVSLAAHIMSAGGWTVVDVIMFVCFAIGTPWTVVGFWNSVIGLWLLHFHKDPMGAGGALRSGRRRADAYRNQDRNVHDVAQRGSRRAPSGGCGSSRTVSTRPAKARSSAISCCPTPTNPMSLRPKKRRSRRGRRVIPTPRGSRIGAGPTTPVSRPAMSATSASDGARTSN